MGEENGREDKKIKEKERSEEKGKEGRGREVYG